jgi:hypothetical protein
MSRIDFGSWTLIEKCRKDHVCCECDRAIPKGSAYELFKGGGDGQCWTAKTCLQCVSLRAFLNISDWEDETSDSIQDAADYHALHATGSSGQSCSIRSEYPELVRDRTGRWIVAGAVA